MVVDTLLEHLLCNVVDSIGFVTAVMGKTHTSLNPTESLILSGFFDSIQEAAKAGKFQVESNLRKASL